MPELRPYRPADRAAVYEICVRTADAGADATGQYSSDELMPDIYAGPYLEYAPELATLVVDGAGESERVLGYIIAADQAKAEKKAQAEYDRLMKQTSGTARSTKKQKTVLEEVLGSSATKSVLTAVIGGIFGTRKRR